MTMGQKHVQVVFAADIEEAAAFELFNNLCHSPPEKLNFYNCSQIPSTAWQKLRGASWTNLREANFFGCLVLQTWLRCLASSLDAVFFSPIVTGCFLVKMQKCEIDSCKWSDLQKSLARGAATDFRPFIDSRDKMAYLCHPLTWHIVLFSRLPKPPSCAIHAEFQWIS